MLADVEDRHDVRLVGDLRGRARLALEAFARAGVGGELGAEHLDRDDPSEEQVLGLPDGGHAAAGDVAGDAVALRQLDGEARGICRSTVPAAAPGQPVARAAGASATATLLGAMAKVCHSCGKRPAFGQSRSHSMVATKRRFNPNLQKVRIFVGSAPRRVYVCTRCLKAGKVTKAV